MNKYLLLGMLLFTSVSWAQDATPAPGSTITYKGGDGSSFKNAVLIVGAKTDGDATDSEYRWLAKQFPHYRMIRQSLLNNENRVYDLLKFTAADGQEHSVYFDITDSFGKM